MEHMSFFLHLFGRVYGKLLVELQHDIYRNGKLVHEATKQIMEFIWEDQ